MVSVGFFMDGKGIFMEKYVLIIKTTKDIKL